MCCHLELEKVGDVHTHESWCIKSLRKYLSRIQKKTNNKLHDIMNHIVNYLEAILSMLRIFLIIELFPYFSSHMMNKWMEIGA